MKNSVEIDSVKLVNPFANAPNPQGDIKRTYLCRYDHESVFTFRFSLPRVVNLEYPCRSQAVQTGRGVLRKSRPIINSQN